MDAAGSGDGIPGVIGGGGSLPDFLSAGLSDDGGTPAAPSAPGEASAGAEAGVPASGAESVAGASADGGQQQLPADGQEQPGATEPFTFAGKQYPTREAAENDLRAAMGRSQAEQRRAAALERQAREAANVARAWMEYAQSGQRQGQPQPVEPAKATEPEKPWHEGLDYDLAEELAQEKGIGTALYYLAQQMEARLQESLKATEERFVNEHMAPLQQERAVTQQYQTVMGFFEGAASADDGAGNPLFPELSDPASQADVARIWVDLFKRNPALAQSEEGVELAITRYRRVNGGRDATPPPPNPANGSPAGASGASGVLQNAARAAAASSEVLTGSGHPRPAAQGAPGADFRALIGGGNTVKDGKLDLGFAPAHITV